MTRVGILGGGQLGRMLALAGHTLGVETRVLDPAADAPAGRVTEHRCAPFDDEEALAAFSQGLDVVTYELEHLPLEAARVVARHATLRPSVGALAVTQDRLHEKMFLRGLGLETAPFRQATGAGELEAALRAVGLPAVVKHRRHGYDGRGQRVVRDAEDAARACAVADDTPLIVESMLRFAREVSLIAVRSPADEVRCYPLVENRHAGGILRTSIAPAPGLTRLRQREAEGLAGRILEALDYVGVLTVELFELEGRLVVNELAPRVHNSGHWTIEGAVTSQFENHLRAVLSLPLGSTSPRGRTALVNLIGTLPDPARVLAIPGAHLHLYGKAPRPDRKLGHVTLQLGAARVPRRLAALEAALRDGEASSPGDGVGRRAG